MSKGSLFFGHARGKLGQVVLSTVKGQQIARAWQPKVANPRTTAQQAQRAKFANAVKFYRRATSNLFNFAFEDKRKTESDYNAFMRHNVDRAMIVNRASYDNINYPAIGYNWLMSSGSLGVVNPVKNENDTKQVIFRSVALSGEKVYGDFTVADVSAAFNEKLGTLDGDFVTFVAVGSSASEIGDEPSSLPIWAVNQLQLDSNNTTDKIIKIFDSQTPAWSTVITKEGDENYFTVTNASACWFAVILSRVTSSGVLVSSSDLVGNQFAENIYQASLQQSYRAAALNSWDRQANPILKGSIIQESTL